MAEEKDERDAANGTGDVRAPRPIFAVFEGGGAKGIAHVGALQAIQDNGLEIIGVAGTSAGALIAVLAAIGLEAADIMSAVDAKANILARVGRSPIGLLGTREWRSFQRLRKGGKRAMITGALFGLPINLALAPRIMATLWDGVDNRGHFGTTHIEAFINGVIRQRLADIAAQADLDWPVPDKVTFADLARGWPTVVPLKIVVTDVDQGTLEIFDADTTPDVVVAEAVAASISIPVVFRPAFIPSFRPGRFADGGLVSNLPIWSFSEEKLAYEREHYARPPVPVLGFRLAGPAEEAAPGAPLGLLPFLGRLIGAALQGSQGAAHRFLDDVTIVPLETDLKTLDFDAGWKAYAQAREAGRASADRHLRFALQVKPDRIEAELTTVRDAALTLVNAKRGAEKPAVTELRVNLIRPHGAYSLRVMESVGMESDADDRLLLDRRGRGAAEVFRQRGLRRFQLGAKFDDRPREYMTKYERALVRRTVRTVLCVPIFADSTGWALPEADRPEPAGILAIDSDQNLATEFDDNDLWNMLVDQSTVLYEAVSSEIDDGEDREEGAGARRPEAEG
jgi:NTE family protein